MYELKKNLFAYFQGHQIDRKCDDSHGLNRKIFFSAFLEQGRLFAVDLIDNTKRVFPLSGAKLGNRINCILSHRHQELILQKKLE